MKRVCSLSYYFIICLYLLSNPLCLFSQTNTDLIEYNESISKDSLYSTVCDLESYASRYTFNPNRKQVALYLQERFISYGWQAHIDSFYLSNFEYPYHSGIINNGWQYNVVAEKQGSIAPDTIFIAGAHYDSYASYDSNYYDYSPGADDNASGVAAIFETARLFQKHNIVPTKTLRLELYAAEETGLCGSDHAARGTSLRQEHIAAMFCLDMIGYKRYSLWQDSIKLIEYDNSLVFTEFCNQTIEDYTELIPIRTTENYDRSDSYAYYQWGLRAIFMHEAQMNPFYHSGLDIKEYMDFDYLKKTTKAAFSIIYLASTTNDYYPISLRKVVEKKEPKLIITNPQKGCIRFRIENIENMNNARVGLIDSYAREVASYQLENLNKQDSNYIIDAQNLSQGLYILYIRTPNHILSTKTILIK